MKRIAFVFGLAAATAFAAPLAAQSRNDGPWYDPSNTGRTSGGRVDSRDTRVDSRDGRVYDSRVYNDRRADGQWRRAGRDRNGNTIYARTRYDSNRNIVREVAVRDRLGRYRVIDRDIVQYANRRDDRYDRRDDRRLSR